MEVFNAANEERNDLHPGALKTHLGKYYSFDDGDLATLAPFDAQMKLAWLKKDALMPGWSKFTTDIRTCYPHLRLRDFSHEHAEPSIRLQITGDPYGGMYCCVSLLHSLIGFHFACYGESQADEFSMHPIFSTQRLPGLSFKPFNPTLESWASGISRLALHHFDGYSLLSPELCMHEFDQVFIEGLPYRHVQMYNLFFSPYPNHLI